MNATSVVVLMVLVGFACANVGARHFEEVPKVTKLGISIPKTSTTKGLESQLGVVTIYTDAYHSQYATASANNGPDDSSSTGYGSSYGSTGGSVTADGPNADAYSSSGAYGQADAGATAGPDGSSSTGNGYGSANTYASGNTDNSP